MLTWPSLGVSPPLTNTCKLAGNGAVVPMKVLLTAGIFEISYGCKCQSRYMRKFCPGCGIAGYGLCLLFGFFDGPGPWIRKMSNEINAVLHQGRAISGPRMSNTLRAQRAFRSRVSGGPRERMRSLASELAENATCSSMFHSPICEAAAAL